MKTQVYLGVIFFALMREFYKITTSENDFPKNPKLIEINSDLKNLGHYLFFFRDNIFECLAEDYKFESIK